MTTSIQILPIAGQFWCYHRTMPIDKGRHYVIFDRIEDATAFRAYRQSQMTSAWLSREKARRNDTITPSRKDHR